MKKGEQGVLGVSPYLDVTLGAIHGLRGSGFHDLRVFSPSPYHEIDEALESGNSIVRFFTLIGGILGCMCGFLLTILTSIDWPLMTSSKPIVSIPPYVIIAFELTVLLGALATLLGLLVNARLRRPSPKAMYDPRFSEDRFGILVRCEKEDIAKVEEILKSSEVEEVRFEGF